ncbi:MAG: GAF domain-containing protein [Vulcanimicrobiaceae bacterium]
MNASRRWRAALLGLSAIAALALTVAVLGSTPFAPWSGSFGWRFVRAGGPYIVRVVGLDRTRGAFLSGVRVGDRFDLRDYSPPDRWDILATPLVGHAVPLRVLRDGRELSIVAQPVLAPWTWDVWIGTIANGWMLIFAVFLAWRLPNSSEARWISSILLAFVLISALNNIGTPYLALTAALEMLGAALFILPNVMFLIFASTFARPLSILRRSGVYLLYAVSVMGAVSVGLESVLFWFAPSRGSLQAFYPLLALFLPVLRVFGALGIPAVEFLSILYGVLTIAAARGGERQRAAWLLGTLAVFLGVAMIQNGIQSIGNANLALVHGVLALGNAVTILTPVGLAYAVLNRRLLDVGFALNRAAVFTGVSLIVVGAFVLVEWALSQWLSADHLSGIAVNLGLVLVLGLSLRFIHGRVDRFVDRAFFRKRHENEAALRRLAHEASFMTDRDALIDRTIAEVEQHTDAASVAVLLHDDDGGYRSARRQGTPVSENDPALLALRAWRQPIDLHRYATALEGELAFPMFARGEMIGVLVCGLKRGGESYAPDERDALTALASGVGSALDALRDRGEDVQHSILEELRELAQWLHQAQQRDIPEA